MNKGKQLLMSMGQKIRAIFVDKAHLPITQVQFCMELRKLVYLSKVGCSIVLMTGMVKNGGAPRLILQFGRRHPSFATPICRLRHIPTVGNHLRVSKLCFTTFLVACHQPGFVLITCTDKVERRPNTRGLLYKG